MIDAIWQITNIKDEAELLEQFREFATQLDQNLVPLREQLAKQPLTREVPQLEIQMTFVENFRDRVCRRYALAVCFAEHAKSHYFLLAKSKNVTSDDRTAYQKSIGAGMIAVRDDMENLIGSIDSRVNEIKKLLGPEYSVGGKRSNT